MSKYSPLADHFAARTDDHWRASRADIEAVLGAGLPKSAAQPVWWTGTDKPHQRAWLDHGWRVSDIGPSGIGFVRAPLAPTPEPEEAAETSPLKVAGLAAMVAAGLAVAAGLGVVVAKVVRGRKGA